MQNIGIDIGSRTIEWVAVAGREIVESERLETGVHPLRQIQRLMNGRKFENLVATGYGRKLMEENYQAKTVTEIKAYATAAHHYYPQIKTILDIGGQDIKVIALHPEGAVRKFEMNDKCAAGTGKFLEIMAMSMGQEIGAFGDYALSAPNSITINSTCTVFAESEVASLLAQGMGAQNIAHGIHDSVVKRVASMITRISWEKTPLLFAGGVALNPCIRELLKKKLERELVIPEQPQFFGALGAALLAENI